MFRQDSAYRVVSGVPAVRAVGALNKAQGGALPALRWARRMPAVEIPPAVTSSTYGRGVLAPKPVLLLRFQSSDARFERIQALIRLRELLTRLPEQPYGAGKDHAVRVILKALHPGDRGLSFGHVVSHLKRPLAFPKVPGVGSRPPMRPILLAIALVVAVTFAAPASGHVRRVQRPPLPAPMPRIVAAPCPGLEDAAGCLIPAGVTDATGRPYATAAVFTTGDRFTTAHELGHAYDAAMMDDMERHAFSHILGRLDEYWSSTYTDEDGRVLQYPDSLAEVFADAYANCRLGHVVAPGHAWEAGYNYYPTARENRRICGLITRAGRDAGQPASVDGMLG
jgi:hypothetical protein